MTDHTDSERHLAEIHRKLEHLGLTPLARDWLIKALHPAATHECPGIPDPYEGQLVTPDFKDSKVIGAPGGVTGDWDLLVVQVPGDNIGFAYASGPAGTDFTLPIASLPANIGIGCTINQQTVVGSQPVGVVEVGLTGATLLVPVLEQASSPWAWRRRYSGLTCYMTASALNDQGTVFASSFATPKVKCGPTVIGTAGSNYAVQASDTALAYVRPHAWSVPLDETSLQLASPKPYVAPARHGVYIPARFMGFDMTETSFVKTGQVVFTSANEIASVLPSSINLRDAYPCTAVVELSNKGGQIAWPSLAYGTPATRVGGITQSDTNHSDMTVQVAIFRGLANSAQITVRSYFGLEVTTTANSSQRQFAKPAPPFSDLALRTYSAVLHEMAYCYPASYNSWGDLLAVIHKVAAVLYPFARPLLGSVPVVGGLLQSAGDAFLRPHPSMSEVQRVSTSDPRPLPKPPMVGRPPASKMSKICPQCKAGVPHRHKAAAITSLRRKKR